MGPVVYDNECLSAHTIYKECGSTLYKVSKKDYPKKNYFDKNIFCLDMDAYETQIRHGQTDCTTDAVIGICSYDNKKLSNPRLLLVELKMDCIGTNGLSKTNLESKVTHTKQLLGSELTINTESIFVFSDNMVAQAKHWVSFRQKEGGEIRRFVVYSLNDFKTNIQSYESLPYTPIHPKEEVMAELNKFLCDREYSVFISKINYWLKYAESIRYSNVFEYDSIKTIITEAWTDFREKHTKLNNDDDEIYALILDEDIPTVLR